MLKRFYEPTTFCFYGFYMVALVIGFISTIWLMFNHLNGNSLLFGQSTVPDFLVAGYVITAQDIKEIEKALNAIGDLSEFAFYSSVYMFVFFYGFSLILTLTRPKIYYWSIKLLRKVNSDFGKIIIPATTISRAEEISISEGHDYDEDAFLEQVRGLIEKGDILTGYHKVGPLYVYILRPRLIDRESSDIKGYVMVESIDFQENAQNMLALN